MDRLHGMEAFLGIGGGNLVSIESEECLNQAVALRREGKLDEAAKKLEEAMRLDPNNLDAEIEYACMRPSAQEAIKVLVESEKKGKALLIKSRGPLAFDDKGGDVGQYWDILETRPYMRILLILERLYFETKEFDKGCSLLEELMRLRPGDNLSVRKFLGTALIRNGRYKHALSFAQQWLVPNRHHTPQRGGIDYPKPEKKPQYTKDQEHQLCTQTFNHPSQGRGIRNTMFISKKCLADLLHTAALSSFKLWGDNEQARQYLRIGARVNPGILLKILGKVDRPKSVNKEARHMNGPEDARDYLWYGQDLWMTDDVWNWANNYLPAKEAILKECSLQGCQVREKDACEFKRCSDCHLVSYCSPQCQKEDWKNHKPTCRQRLEFKKTTKSFGRGEVLPHKGPNILSPDYSHSMGAGVVNEAIKKVAKSKKRQSAGAEELQ